MDEYVTSQIILIITIINIITVVRYPNRQGRHALLKVLLMVWLSAYLLFIQSCRWLAHTHTHTHSAAHIVTKKYQFAITQKRYRYFVRFLRLLHSVARSFVVSHFLERQTIIPSSLFRFILFVLTKQMCLWRRLWWWVRVPRKMSFLCLDFKTSFDFFNEVISKPYMLYFSKSKRHIEREIGKEEKRARERVKPRSLFSPRVKEHVNDQLNMNKY